MQIRSFRGSGEPAWVNALLPSARDCLGPDPRRALGPAATNAAPTGRTRDRTRPTLQNVRKFLPGRRPHVTHFGHRRRYMQPPECGNSNYARCLVNLGCGYATARVYQNHFRLSVGVAAGGTRAATLRAYRYPARTLDKKLARAGSHTIGLENEAPNHLLVNEPSLSTQGIGGSCGK